MAPIRWLEVPGDPRNNYLARMDWAANSDEVVIQQLDRLQNEHGPGSAACEPGRCVRSSSTRDSAWVYGQ